MSVMKRFIPVVLVAAALGTLAYFAANLTSREGLPLTHCRCTGWLSAEFRVDSSVCAKIRAAQEDFAKDCDANCTTLRLAQDRLRSLPADAPASDREAAERAVRDASARQLAVRVAQAHRIAGMLPAGSRDKYLAVVLPRLEQSDQAEPIGAAGAR